MYLSSSRLGNEALGPGRRRSTPLTRNWQLVAARGAVSVLFGLFAAVSPTIHLHQLVFLYGVYMLLDGGLAIAAALRAGRNHDRWGMLLLEGLIDLLAGAYALSVPDLGLLLFVVLLASWAVVSGATLAAAGLQVARRSGRWLLVSSGLVSAAWGVLVLLAPATRKPDLVWWLGAYAEAFGILLVLLALQLRSGEPRQDPV